MYYKGKTDSPIGTIIYVTDQDELQFLWLEKGLVPKEALSLLEIIEKPIVLHQQINKVLEDYFEGNFNTMSTIPLKISGSSFSMAVWNEVSRINTGETITYKELAERLQTNTPGKRVANQAVGGALKRNPILLFVPCHRVVGSNQSLTGYAGGLGNKEWLLNHEKKYSKKAKRDDEKTNRKNKAIKRN